MEIPGWVLPMCDSDLENFKDDNRDTSDLPRSRWPRITTTECNKQKADALITKDWRVLGEMQEMIKTVEYWKVYHYVPPAPDKDKWAHMHIIPVTSKIFCQGLPPYSPDLVPSDDQGTTKITRDRHYRNEAGQQTLSTWLQNSEMDFYCSAIFKHTGRNAWIVLWILLNSDRTSPVTKDSICFGACTFALI